MAGEDLLHLLEQAPVVQQSESYTLWGVVDSVSSSVIGWRPVGMSFNESPFQARLKLESVGTLAVGDKIECVQYGRGGWIIRGKVVEV